MRGFVLMLVGVVCLPWVARAQTVDPYRPTVGGMPVSCVSYTGQPVVFQARTTLTDVGLARPEAPGVAPRIEYNPLLLARLSPLAQLFWYGHVCAHLVLADADSEENADRWALQLLKQQGLVDPWGIAELSAAFAGIQGPAWSHRPSGARLGLLDACYAQPPGEGWFDQQVYLREAYQGVKRWRFCSHIQGVSTPTSSGFVSRLSCEEARATLVNRNATWRVSECLLTASERCSADPG